MFVQSRRICDCFDVCVHVKLINKHVNCHKYVTWFIGIPSKNDNNYFRSSAIIVLLFCRICSSTQPIWLSFSYDVEGEYSKKNFVWFKTHSILDRFICSRFTTVDCTNHVIRGNFSRNDCLLMLLLLLFMISVISFYVCFQFFLLEKIWINACMLLVARQFLPSERVLIDQPIQSILHTKLINIHARLARLYIYFYFHCELFPERCVIGNIRIVYALSLFAYFRIVKFAYIQCTFPFSFIIYLLWQLL